MQDDLFQTATSSQQDTHASPLVLPASKEARKMTAISGRKYLPLLKQNSLAGAFSRMFMDTSAWASTKCYLTWRGKVTPAKRLLFQLVPSMLHTDEIEFGLLPTPTTQDNPQVRGEGKTIGTKRGTTLGGYARMWATPRTTDGTGGPRKLDEKGRRISQTNPHLVFGANLADQVRMWPTPTANEDAAGTPEGKMQRQLGNHPDIRGTTPEEWKRGSLNPQWVEWLMGYPEGWTDLKD
jgi:hypothetical protein